MPNYFVPEASKRMLKLYEHTITRAMILVPGRVSTGTGTIPSQLISLIGYGVVGKEDTWWALSCRTLSND